VSLESLAATAASSRFAGRGLMTPPELLTEGRHTLECALRLIQCDVRLRRRSTQRRTWADIGIAPRTRRDQWRQWHDRHRQRCAAGCQVPDLCRGSPQSSKDAGGHQRHGRALPDRMHQAPAQPFDQGRTKPVCPCRHEAPPSRSRLSINLRISASSSADAFSVASACMTNFEAEPPNARRTRSPISCPCVCASLRLAR
jgi:hypothetical protein